MSKLTKLPPFKQPGEDEIEAFKEHISFLEKNDCELYEGQQPVEAGELYDELLSDYDNAYKKYIEKRIRLTGTISHIGKDEYDAPSFQFVDEKDTQCFALIVVSEEDMGKVSEGDRAEIIGNIVLIREPYSLVVKKCELLDVIKQQ